MERDDYLAALRRDGAALADACEIAGLDSAVPSCPGWTVADLLWHVGDVHHFWRTMVAEGAVSPQTYVQPQRPADADLLAWYRTGLDETVAVLAAADPAAPVWTWTTDRTAGWVLRRMAHETAVHRSDAEQAAGREVPVDGPLASDGIDEFLTWFPYAGRAAEGAAPVDGSVHLHCTDVAGEWTVRDAPGGRDVTREHAKGDAALRGAASDLLLVLWRRLPLSTVDVVGDADVAARFVAHPDLG